MPCRTIGIAAALLMLNFALAGTCRAEEPRDLVKASLVADTDAVAPGGNFTLGIRFTIKPHWHIYWKNPGEAGDATRVKLSGPAGLGFGDVQFPLPTKIESDGGVTYGYEKEVMLMVPVTVSKDFATGETTIRAELTWQSCKDTCIDGEAKVALTLPVGPRAGAANRVLFETWRGRLPAAQAGEVIAKIDQEKPTEVTVHWKQSPAGKVDWYPVSTEAVAIENVTVAHQGNRTTIRFKPTVYKPADVPEGRVQGVLVFEDSTGRRRGVELPVKVSW